MSYIKQTISNGASDQMQNWSVWLLGGIGVSVAGYEFAGGILLSCAAAAIMAYYRKDRKKALAMYLTAIFFATIVASLWPKYGWEDVSVPIAMGVSGLLSWGVPAFIAAFVGRAAERAPDVVDAALEKVNIEKVDKGEG